MNLRSRMYKIEGYLWSISLPRVTCMHSKTTSPRTERRLPSITRLAHQPGILKRCGKPIVNRSSNRRILMQIYRSTSISFFSKRGCTRDLKSIFRKQWVFHSIIPRYFFYDSFFLPFLIHFSFIFFIFRTRE